MDVCLAEYLRTEYSDGDREYIDGEVVERNIGRVDHADWMSSAVCHILATTQGLWAGVTVRTRVAPNRVLVPDIVCIANLRLMTEILETPPCLVVEVLAPEDRAQDLLERVDAFLAFGVPCVWILDPRSRRGFIYTADGMREAKDGVLRTTDPEITLPLAEIS